MTENRPATFSMKFSPTIYSRLKSRLKTKYAKIRLQIFKEFRAYPDSKTADVLHEFKEELTPYSSLNWFLMGQIQLYLSFAKMNKELISRNPFGPKEEAVFEKWNQSDFADHFLKALNSGSSVKKASETTLQRFDQHLAILIERQVLKSNKFHPAYRPQPSLGEYQQGKKIGRLLETTLHLEGKELGLKTRSITEMKVFSQKIEIALKVIRKFSPASWERFKAFTEVIIPIKETEFVSYSHQDLPGVSMINLYNRDFVDLMDDLLHENGHHHLNYYLNLGKLIDEPIDNIYYSPWRRTLRPLRGIYHAYFTFFWAFQLFADLARAKDPDSIWYLFSAKDKQKMMWRAVEEYHMLNFSFNDLKWAYRQGLIKPSGWELIQEQQKHLKKFSSKVILWEKKISLHRKELNDLKKTLHVAHKELSKN